MPEFPKPRIVVSRCLGSDRCRYDGAIITDPFTALLRNHVEFIPVCPELEIGLGVPRAPIRIVSAGGSRRLVQPSTGRDVTGDMETFAARFLDTLETADGFLLKGRSPSCGVRDAKIFSPDGMLRERSAGFFAEAAAARFPDAAMEDEGRLTNHAIREHFLIRVFTAARFRAIAASGSLAELVRFQAENKLLLMAHNQRVMRELGGISANREYLRAADVIANYGRLLPRAFSRAAGRTAHINVLMHALGYFSERLTAGEKAFFLDSLDRFRNRKIPLSAVTGVVQAWIARFGEPYLAAQTWFAPYPEALVQLTGPGNGRE